MGKIMCVSPNRLAARNFSGIVSNYLSRCIWLVNKLPRAYQSRKQHHSSLWWSSSAERKTRVASRSRGLTRTINFSTSRFENSSRGRTHPRISITCPKNRAAAYPFLFLRRPIYPYRTTRDIFLLHVSPIN